MSDIILKVEKLSKIYKNKDVLRKGEKSFQALNNVSFEVKKGEIFSIIGLNGAGKTSLIKLILGLMQPTEGSIEIFEKEHIKRQDYALIGYLPEISYYPKEVTLKSLMSYYADLYHIKNKSSRVLDVIEKVGLSHKLNVKLEKFSKGMLQRVGVAQAIINRPQLLILDEPMSGLDPLGRKLIKELIIEFNAQGTTVILTTHILSDIESFGGNIAIINEGKLKKTFSFSQEEMSHYEITYRDISKSVKENKILKIEEPNLSQTIEKLIKSGMNIESIEHSRKSLETIFLEAISHKSIDKSTLK
ncbi:MAG: ABC transporter ATP-binding protein [Fusobacteria bacterium]|nr:ABC transporter ATP-binding protein [Fusobacteriota bacterium]